MTAGFEPEVAPSGPGRVECEEDGGWWVHHAATGHPVMQSYEPGEDWQHHLH